MAGIAVGWSDIANGLLVYNPVSKELYTTSLYKIDEHQATKNYFNLSYDGGMFTGLYSIDSKQNIPEHFPIGTAVSISSTTNPSHGYVVAVPIINSHDHNTDPTYTIQLLNGDTTMVPASVLHHFIDTTNDKIKISLPSWLRHDAKVRYTTDTITHQGRIQLTQNNSWQFIVKNKLGSIIKQTPLANLMFTFQQLINDGILQPGWLNHPHCSAFNVSAK